MGETVVTDQRETISGDELGMRLGYVLSKILWDDERVVRLYIANGGRGSAEKIAGATNRSVAGVRSALETLRSRGEIVSDPESPGRRGRPHLIYRAVNSQRDLGEIVVKRRAKEYPSVWHATNADIASDFEHLVSEFTNSTTDPEAMTRLERVIKSVHPSVLACTDAFERGLPSPIRCLAPLLWIPVPDWGPCERYIQRAYGFAGTLVQGLKTDPNRAFTFGIDLWVRNGIVVGTGVEIGKIPRREEMLFEWLFFQLVGFRPRQCGQSDHWYFADYHAQNNCLAHTDIARQKHHRRGLMSQSKD